MDLASLQMNYSFSRGLTLSGLTQVNTANTHAVSANIRLRFNYRADSDLYIIYNAGPRFASLSGAPSQQVDEQRLTVKFTYSFIR